jgi:prepilin-type N-terminal cleavage/methylation domain-containing protein/prepilin-type processing-associated H-X9-DG protein
METRKERCLHPNEYVDQVGRIHERRSQTAPSGNTVNLDIITPDCCSKNRTIRPHCKSNIGFTLIELLVVIAIIGILAGLLLAALGRAKGNAQNAACGNNLRQLGIATRLYSDSNQERLPSAEVLPTSPIDPQNPLPRICDVLASYVGWSAGRNTNSATVFKCPADKAGRFAAEGSSYEWNANLNGHRIDETQTLPLGKGTDAGVLAFPPVTTPLLLDYDDFHPRPPKSGKNVAFMDGHVAPLDAVVNTP